MAPAVLARDSSQRQRGEDRGSGIGTVSRAVLPGRDAERAQGGKVNLLLCFPKKLLLLPDSCIPAAPPRGQGQECHLHMGFVASSLLLLVYLSVWFFPR